MDNRRRRRRDRSTVEIRTDQRTVKHYLTRDPGRLDKFGKVLELDTSKEPESKVCVGDWVWVQYQKENDELDNNLALVVAILRYENNRVDVALLWGKEMRRRNEEPVRVVCTDNCWIVPKESIGGRVVESESSDRVITENSAGEIFSLDRYYILSSSRNRPERLESVSFEAWSGRPPRRFLEELHFDKTSPSEQPAQEVENQVADTREEDEIDKEANIGANVAVEAGDQIFGRAVMEAEVDKAADISIHTEADSGPETEMDIVADLKMDTECHKNTDVQLHSVHDDRLEDANDDECDTQQSEDEDGNDEDHDRDSHARAGHDEPYRPRQQQEQGNLPNENLLCSPKAKRRLSRATDDHYGESTGSPAKKVDREKVGGERAKDQGVALSIEHTPRPEGDPVTFHVRLVDRQSREHPFQQTPIFTTTAERILGDPFCWPIQRLRHFGATAVLEESRDHPPWMWAYNTSLVLAEDANRDSVTLRSDQEAAEFMRGLVQKGTMDIWLEMRQADEAGPYCDISHSSCSPSHTPRTPSHITGIERGGIQQEPLGRTEEDEKDGGFGGGGVEDSFDHQDRDDDEEGQPSVSTDRNNRKQGTSVSNDIDDSPLPANTTMVQPAEQSQPLVNNTVANVIEQTEPYADTTIAAPHEQCKYFAETMPEKGGQQAGKSAHDLKEDNGDRGDADSTATNSCPKAPAAAAEDKPRQRNSGPSSLTSAIQLNDDDSSGPSTFPSNRESPVPPVRLNWYGLDNDDDHETTHTQNAQSGEAAPAKTVADGGDCRTTLDVRVVLPSNGVGDAVAVDADADDDVPVTDLAFESLPSAARHSREELEAYFHAFRVPEKGYVPERHLAIKGFRPAHRPKGYQHSACFWMLSHEGRYGGSMRVGGICALQMGLGKTLVAIVMFVYTHIMAHQMRRVRAQWASTEKTTMHLPQGCDEEHATCPSGGDGLEKEGWQLRCYCEPKMRGLYDSVHEGMTAFVAPLGVLKNWEEEFQKLVDVEAIQARTGETIRLEIAHENSARGGKTLFETNARDLKPAALRVVDWKGEEGMSGHESIWRSIHDRANAGAPPDVPKPRSLDHIGVLTTPQSMKSRLLDHIDTIYRPALSNWSHDCDKAKFCNKHSAKANCPNKSHYWDESSETVCVLPVGRFFVDEAHDINGPKTGFRADIERHMSIANEVLGVRSSLWQLSGTPASKGLADPIALFAAQRDDRWRDQAELRPWSTTKAIKWLQWDAMAAKAREGKDIRGKELRNLTSYSSKLGDDELRKEFLALYEENVVPRLQRFYDNHLLRIKEEDHFNGTPIIKLPPQEMREVCFALGDGLDAAHEAVQATMQKSKTVEKLLAARNADMSGGTKKIKEGNEHLQKARERLTLGMRALNVTLAIPHVGSLIVEDPKMLLAKTIRYGGWWKDPATSPLWSEADALLRSSPKLQYLVDTIRHRPVVNANIDYVTDKGKDHTWVVQYRKRLVVACAEPITAFCTRLVLRHALRDLYTVPDHPVEEAIECLQIGTDGPRLVSLFNLEPDKSRPPEQQKLGPDVLIIVNRIGGQGITLNQADTLVAVDLEPRPGLAAQVAKRNHRIGQKAEKVFYTQLVTENWNVEPQLLAARQRGQDVTRLALEGTPRENANREVQG